MKEKRQQRDDEQSKSFCLPTGGVDVAQLHALGLPCPPPYRINHTPMTHGSPGFNVYPGINQSPSPIPVRGLMGTPRMQLQYHGMPFSGFHPMTPPFTMFSGARKSPNQIFGHISPSVESPNGRKT